MASTIYLLLTIAVGLASAEDIGRCGKYVEGLDDFNYDLDVVGTKWTFEYVPNLDFYVNQVNAGVFYVTKNLNNTYTSSLIWTLKDRTTSGSSYLEQNLGNSTIFKTQLDKKRNLTGNTYAITFYAYKPNVYLSYYICSYNGNESSLDSRFVMVPRGKALTKKQRLEIYFVDAKQNFQGNISLISRIKDIPHEPNKHP